MHYRMDVIRKVKIRTSIPYGIHPILTLIGQSIITTSCTIPKISKKKIAYVRGRFIVGDEKLEATAEFDTSAEDAWSLDLPKGLVCVDLTFSTQMQRRYAAPAKNGLDSRAQLF